MIKVRPNGNGKRDAGNGGANGHGRGRWLRVLVLALALVLVAVLAWRLYARWRGPVRTVLVAATNLAPGSQLGEGDLEPARRRASQLPAGALDPDAEVEGRRLVRGKREGEPLAAGDLASPNAGSTEQPPGLSELLPKGRVLMEVRVSLENVVMLELRQGDRLDLLSPASRSAGRPRVVARDAYVMAYVNPNRLRQQADAAAARRDGNGDRRQGLIESLVRSSTVGQRQSGPVMTTTTNMLLALTPESVLPVAQAAGGGALDVILHAREDVKEGSRPAIDGAAWGVELISGAARDSVEFVQ